MPLRRHSPQGPRCHPGPHKPLTWMISSEDCCTSGDIGMALASNVVRANAVPSATTRRSFECGCDHLKSLVVNGRCECADGQRSVIAIDGAAAGDAAPVRASRRARVAVTMVAGSRDAACAGHGAAIRAGDRTGARTRAGRTPAGRLGVIGAAAGGEGTATGPGRSLRMVARPMATISEAETSVYFIRSSFAWRAEDGRCLHRVEALLPPGFADAFQQLADL